MKRKFLIPCLAAAAAASLALGLSACSDSGAQFSGVREEFTGSMYVDTVPSWREQALIDGGYTFTGEGVTLDGKLDEAAWQQVYPLTYTSVGVTVSVYVVFGEDGFYVGYDVEDNEAYFHENRASENNSSIEIYFSPVGTTTLNETVLQVRMEPNNDFTCYRALGAVDAQLSFPWSAEYLPVYGLSQAEAGWETDAATGGMITHGGLQYEMFVGWDTLSLTEAPESIKLYPCYNYINNSLSDGRRVSQVWPQGRYNEPMDYYTFDAQGYVGNPGLNMFDDMMRYRVSANGLVGLRLTWRLGALYTRRADLASLDNERRQIRTARETFLLNNRQDILRLTKEAERLERLRPGDRELVRLRTSIRRAAESKLRNGVIDTDALLAKITDEHRARVQASIHAVEHLKSLYALQILTQSPL